MTKHLLDDKFLPITRQLFFINSQIEPVVDAYIHSWTDYYKSHETNKNIHFERRYLKNTFENTLRELEPLTGYDRKYYLFAPTQSDWVAYFDNGLFGTEGQPLKVTGLHYLKTDVLRVVSQSRRNLFGGSALIFELFSPHATNPTGTRRAISLVCDDLKWEFDIYGAPLAFEDTQRYLARRKKDRFTFEMLDHYLKQLGISAFDEDFYMPEGSEAILVEKQGQLDITTELTLAEARARI